MTENQPEFIQAVLDECHCEGMNPLSVPEPTPCDGWLQHRKCESLAGAVLDFCAQGIGATLAHAASATAVVIADWIPCAEQLPIACSFRNDVSESDEVLVTYDGHVAIAALERYEDGLRIVWRAAGDHVLESVTHWMPLPTAPGPEGR